MLIIIFAVWVVIQFVYQDCNIVLDVFFFILFDVCWVYSPVYYSAHYYNVRLDLPAEFINNNIIKR